MNFAQDQLKKYGWSKGKGLGRSESGIVDAIKPKLKFDTAGVGHNAGEQFSFHWWDHVFNKAAKNIEVESSDEGVNVKRKGARSNLISNKKTDIKAKHKSLLYGSFVKHGTMKSDGLVSQEPSSSSSSSESEPEDCPLESYEGHDEKLYKACGGRTAHKGARHGLHLPGKRQRIEEQENFQSKKEKAVKQKSGVDFQCKSTEDEEVGKKKEKKKKRKRKLAEIEANDEECREPLDGDQEERTDEESRAKIKRKKKKNRTTEDKKDLLDCESADSAEIGSADAALTSLINGDGDESFECRKEKKRTKKSNASNRGIEYVGNEDSSRTNGLLVDGEEIQKKKKKKQKSKKNRSLPVDDGRENNELQDCEAYENGIVIDEDGTQLIGAIKKHSKKKKKSKRVGQCE